MKNIETKRLILRGFTIEDVEDVYDYAKDEETVRYLTWPVHKDIQATEKIVKEFYMNDNTFAITLKESNKCIGCIDIRIDEKNNKLEFGYVLNKKHWNKGYMSEVLKEVIRYSFLELNLNRVEATYYAGNIGSRRVMEKCGMKKEGIGIQEVFIKRRYFDVVHMAILKEEYLSE